LLRRVALLFSSTLDGLFALAEAPAVAAAAVLRRAVVLRVVCDGTVPPMLDVPALFTLARWLGRELVCALAETLPCRPALSPPVAEAVAYELSPETLPPWLARCVLSKGCVDAVFCAAPLTLA
jgi:hypothetical protein